MRVSSRAFWPDDFQVALEEVVENMILLRLFKNVQMQVELCEIPLAGA
jgi:hypothetical protein